MPTRSVTKRVALLIFSVAGLLQDPDILPWVIKLVAHYPHTAILLTASALLTTLYHNPTAMAMLGLKVEKTTAEVVAIEPSSPANKP